MFSTFFQYIWPLAGPNIARKGWPLQKLARDDRQTHFGTFNFWTKPLFEHFGCIFLDFGTLYPQRPPPETHFWTLQYRKVSFLANGKSLYPHLWCGLTMLLDFDCFLRFGPRRQVANCLNHESFEDKHPYKQASARPNSIACPWSYIVSPRA